MFVAEGTIWVGFGALLPILPIYFVEHGVDLPTLGVVVAAWPAARLIGEPVFGWVADRGPRKAMMVIGLLLAAVFAVAPLFVVGPAAFIVVRALSGLSASIYDPAARGYLVDANPPERHGELFGLYGAAQMGGLMIGPAIGGIAAAITNQPTVVFWVAGLAILVSAGLVAARVPNVAHPAVARPGDTATDADPATAGAVAEAATDTVAEAARPPARLVNRLLIAALAFNVGSYFAGGTYEVVWSLYMTELGASLGLIGLTFFTFALPILVLSPYFGRLIDREGGFFALVIGMAGVGICGLLYPVVPEIWFMAALGIVEGTAFALASPALFLLVARASPPDRSSTAQGIFGAAGTMGTIVASLAAGALAAEDLTYPFYATGIAALSSLALGLVIGRRRLWDAMQPRLARASAAASPSAVPGDVAG
jgi:MFS family permease